MKNCKTCKHWTLAENVDEKMICNPNDPDTHKPMKLEFEVRVCKMPTQTFCETPVERNGFGLSDASLYRAVLATAEEFGCIRHEAA